ncbi:MAG: pantoate--beta-alanine ligase [Firmicutes bacterium]|nr:pantoate--beta-alanine ligase [Bacillota bacterium]
MIIARTIEEARKHVWEWKARGYTVGLCPTMGYLHEGHISLMKASKRDNDVTVASIFVNPMQFGPTEDLAKYPRDFERDCKMLEAEGVDMVFAPEPGEMYLDDFCTFVDMTLVSEGLCGRSRPVMFRGVCTVLTKLINIIYPNRMYMGKKDCQQLAVVRRMARDLNFNLEVVGCATVREEDGLAKSSRNTYLSPEERAAARVLSRTLRQAQEKIAAGETDSEDLIAFMTEELGKEPLADIDYVEIVDGLTMQPIPAVREGDVIAMAVRIGTTRLIDNFIAGDPLIELG